MYILYGIRLTLVQHNIGGPFEESDEKDSLATFDTRELAAEYVRKSTLKNPVPRRGFTPAKVYRKDSLLRGYSYAEIETHVPEDLPHNPE